MVRSKKSDGLIVSTRCERQNVVCVWCLFYSPETPQGSARVRHGRRRISRIRSPTIDIGGIRTADVPALGLEAGDRLSF